MPIYDNQPRGHAEPNGNIASGTGVYFTGRGLRGDEHSRKYTKQEDIMSAIGGNDTEETVEFNPQEQQLADKLQEDIRKEVEAEAAKAEGITEATYNSNEVVTLAEQSLDFLAALCLPTVFEFAFPPVLQAAWYILVSKVKLVRDFSRIALGIPRGHAKTTLIKLFLVYVILFTQKKFILVLAANASMAENIISDVCDMLGESNIIKLFGDWSLGAETNRNDLKKFNFRGRTVILAAIGAGGSVRGLNLKNERPDVIVFDDVQTKECSESHQQSLALIRWMIGTAMKAASPRGCLYIFCGNMYPGPDSILKKLKTNANWIKFISGAILADGTALWEELKPLAGLLEELDNDLSMGHPEIFFSEVMNDTEVSINNRVDFADIKPWKWTKVDQPQGKFIIIDPASDKKNSDNVAIGYFEIYDGTPGLRSCIQERLSPGNTIRRALYEALRTGTRCIVVESQAYQYSLLYWFEEISKQLGLEGFYFVDIYSGNYSKNSRISDMLKELTSSELFVHPECLSDVTHQISNWNPLKRDNTDELLDLLSYARRSVELYGNMMLTDYQTLMQESSGNSGVDEFNTPF